VNSFGLALGAVFLAIGVLFRSARLVVITLIPNVMPIAWTGGAMGLLGIDLSTGTAMIASAVIGLVVDDTIHYVTSYTRSFRGDPAQAIRRTNAGVGPALVMNNLVLVLGFWVGCFGSFKPTVYFSLLSGATMLSAMLCDLYVTPACLMLFDRRRRSAA
jgi:predicted RND superfamily exporter protein